MARYFCFFLNCAFLTFGLSSAQAAVIPIDLNDFFADPSVSVSLDGSSASFAEDLSLPSVLLANDPGLGDPNVVIPGVGTLLMFDFDFMEAGGNDDVFSAFILDATTGLSIAPFVLFINSVSVGSVSFDLTSLVGESLGLQFELGSNIGDQGIDSTLQISNVRLVTPMVGVPEPTGLALLGLACLAAVRGKKMT